MNYFFHTCFPLTAVTPHVPFACFNPPAHAGPLLFALLVLLAIFSNSLCLYKEASCAPTHLVSVTSAEQDREEERPEGDRRLYIPRRPETPHAEAFLRIQDTNRHAICLSIYGVHVFGCLSFPWKVSFSLALVLFALSFLGYYSRVAAVRLLLSAFVSDVCSYTEQQRQNPSSSSSSSSSSSTTSSKVACLAREIFKHAAGGGEAQQEDSSSYPIDNPLVQFVNLGAGMDTLFFWLNVGQTPSADDQNLVTSQS